MLGTAATVDDGDADPGTVSHKQERLQPWRAKCRHDVGYQVVGVL